MCLEVIALREGTAADAADERPFPGVRASVPAKVRLLRERPTAQLALERTLARVGPEVHPQHAVVGEATVAREADEPASVGPFVVVVATHVLVEVAALCERAIALRADVRTFTGVQAQVSLQIAALREAAVADLADEWALPRVRTLVSLQV